jgi:hypothetical protein
VSPPFGNRYLRHLDAYLVNVGPAAAGLLGGSGEVVGTGYQLVAEAHSLDQRIPGECPPSVRRIRHSDRSNCCRNRGGQFTAATIGVATVGIGFYNVGVFTSGLVYAAVPGWNGLPAEECK